MNTDSPRVRPSFPFWILLPIVGALSIVAFGCGPSEEATEEGWEETPAVSPTATLEYRIDSLTNDNLKLREQIDAVTTENRTLRARTAELETKIAEAAAAQPAPTVAPATGDLRSGYNAALDQYMAHNYQGAIQQFEALLKGGIGDDLAPNCHYWIGESKYGMGSYEEAIANFQKVFDYTKSGKKPYAQLMIGNSYAAMGNSAAAREAYNSVVSNYPASALVGKAQERLARLR